jgi:hypothetical protein
MEDMYCKNCDKEVECNLTFHKGFNGESVKEPNKIVKGYYHFCSTKCIHSWEKDNIKPKEEKSGDARYNRIDCGGAIA